MKPDIRIGIFHTQTYVTTLEMRARQLVADVFSTPSMIARWSGPASS